MKNLVVIHTGAIGDLIQILPTLHALRRAHAGVRITLVGHRERAALAILAGAADVALDLGGSGLWQSGHDPAVALPPVIASADLVLDFLGFMASRLATREAPPTAAPAPLALPRALALAPLPPPEWDRPAADWIGVQIAEHLGVQVAGPPEVPVPPEPVAAAHALLASRGIAGPFVAIHPGSGSLRKNWPIDRFAAVAGRVRDEARRTVVWLAGPAEIERGTIQMLNAELGTRNAGKGNSASAGAIPLHLAPGEHARERTDNDGSPDVLLQDLSLDQVAAVLTLADAYLGNDSGITQIAAAVRDPSARPTPTVALFGPTDARVWGPRGNHVRVIRSPDGSMGGIAAEEVWEELRRFL
jgi:heptosyltransferase III